MRRAATLVGAIVVAVSVMPGPAAARLTFRDGVASGDVTKHTATLWTRTTAAGRVALEVATDRRFQDVVVSRRATARAAHGFTVEVEVRKLAAGATYHFRFLGPGGTRSPVGTFRTVPASQQNLRFVYTGDSDPTPLEGANFRDEIASVARTVRREAPDLFVFLGDTVYSDSGLKAERSDTLEEYRGDYASLRSIQAVRRLLASTSLVTQWDDHEVRNDYAGNPGGLPFAPAGVTAEEVAAGQQAFREAFPIDEGPGRRTYRRLSWGRDLDLFVLDERSFRTSPLPALQTCFQPETGRPDVAPTLPQPVRSSLSGATGLAYLSSPPPPGCREAIEDPSATMLGPEQEAWLKAGLQKSTATFKVIVNEVPIQELYANPYDRWEGYAADRKELLTFIRDAGIEGVVFATTDAHATIANLACIATLAGDGAYACDTSTAPWEVVAGPMGTRTFAQGVNDLAPGTAGLVEGFMRSFLRAPCVHIDEPAAYALVKLSANQDRLRIVPKRPGPGRGQTLCAPIVIEG